jgi:hypothetical protein
MSSAIISSIHIPHHPSSVGQERAAIGTKTFEVRSKRNNRSCAREGGASLGSRSDHRSLIDKP